MEPSHFQKLVTEFPFLPGVLQLAFSNQDKPTRIAVERMSKELVSERIRDDGRPMSTNEWCSSLTTCSQLFAVKRGVVGELTGDYRPCYGYISNGDGTFDYYQWGLYELEDDIPEVVWPILQMLKGDEDYLVKVDYDQYFIEAGPGPLDDDELSEGWYHRREVTIYKPPKYGTLPEYIERWKAIEKREDDRAFQRWMKRDGNKTAS